MQEIMVVNIPSKASVSIYKEAVDLYVKKSKPYVKSVYTFGNVNFPGLSDLDILVVPKRKYLSALRVKLSKSLPKIYDKIILHDPFVLPFEDINISKFIYITNLKRIHGEDLVKINNNFSNTVKFCSILEAMLSYSIFLENFKKSYVLDAQASIPVFSSLRFTVGLVNELNILNKVNKKRYCDNFDLLRASLLDEVENPHDVVVKMYELFFESIMQLRMDIINHCNIDPYSKESILELYFSKKQESYFDCNEANIRYKAIENYILRLNNNGFYYGYVMRTALFSVPKKPLNIRFLEKLQCIFTPSRW
jgi:hypothetical protein